MTFCPQPLLIQHWCRIGHRVKSNCLPLSAAYLYRKQDHRRHNKPNKPFPDRKKNFDSAGLLMWELLWVKNVINKIANVPLHMCPGRSKMAPENYAGRWPTDYNSSSHLQCVAAQKAWPIVAVWCLEFYEHTLFFQNIQGNEKHQRIRYSRKMRPLYTINY